MRKQGRHVSPVFDKDETRRVFAISMDIMGNTAWLRAGAGDVLEAEVKNSAVRFRRGHNAPDNNDHLGISRELWSIRSRERLSA